MQKTSSKNVYGSTITIVTKSKAEPEPTDIELLEFCNYCEPLGGDVKRLHQSQYAVSVYTN